MKSKQPENIWFFTAVLFGIIGVIAFFWYFPDVHMYYFYFMGTSTGSLMMYIGLVDKNKKDKL